MVMNCTTRSRQGRLSTYFKEVSLGRNTHLEPYICAEINGKSKGMQRIPSNCHTPISGGYVAHRRASPPSSAYFPNEDWFQPMTYSSSLNFGSLGGAFVDGSFFLQNRRPRILSICNRLRDNSRGYRKDSCTAQRDLSRSSRGDI